MIISLALSQKSVEIEKNPCSDRTITFARKYGVKALPVKDLPQFFKASKACREKGGETLLEQIDSAGILPLYKLLNTSILKDVHKRSVKTTGL